MNTLGPAPASAADPEPRPGPGPPIRCIALNTGGGDAPGLNAVIRAAVLSALYHGWEVFGIRKGYEGLLDDQLVRLDREAVRGITHLGGTILGTTNRADPFAWPVQQPDGSVTTVDRSNEVVDSFRRHGLDALIAIGGDGSLHIAHRLAQKGLPVVGVPKTIDNDLAATQVSFGFHTAVQTASDALDKLHSTAESHERVMVVEVMGRHTGWIALHAGVSATADVILIPEIPYDLEKVCQKIRERDQTGRRFSIVVVAEGAMPQGGEAVFAEPAAPGRAARYGGIAERLAREIAEQTGKETRSLVLGHLQRGGSPTAYDRLIALRFGAAAVRCVAERRFGTMVALDPPEVHAVPLADAVDRIKRV
ncbi:MAG: ATP-dependent 6-phosphofructokinase, partial [Gemmatimonadetes bacterium]|nr:ATP-dependent 6-phosphofructokinase [Gemmatimonadota bacterium]